MEQKKLEFRDILSECINNPEGEIANTELNEDSQKMLKEAYEVMKVIEENWCSLRQAHANRIDTLTWADERMKELKM